MVLNTVQLFSGRASNYVAEKIADYYGKQLGDVAINVFADGEIEPCYNESIRGSYVFIVQSTFGESDNLMELLLMIDAAKRASAGYIAAVIPYYGYARQDRKDKARVSIGSKLVANLLTAAGADRVMTMDLHAGQIQGFFDIPVDHLNASAVFIPYLKSLESDVLTFASPDVGGVKRARMYAKHLKADLVICDKYRERANEVAGMTVIGDVEGKDVVLVDDICDTANTLCNAANIIMEKGAKSVRAICTHPVFSGKAFENIENSQLTEMVVTDTIPLKRQSDKVKVLSVGRLFAHAIRAAHEHRSINSLFLTKSSV